MSAVLSALIVIVPAVTWLEPIFTSAEPVTVVLIAAPLPASRPMARFLEVASKFWVRVDCRSSSPTWCTPRSPMRTSVVAAIASVVSAPAMPTNRPPLEALARWKTSSCPVARAASTAALTRASSPISAVTEPLSTVLAEDTPTDAPVLTASASDFAMPFCVPRASTSTRVVSVDPSTAVARSCASTTGARRFSVTVPAAAAAIRPKLSAAALTSALVSASSSACTLSVLPVRICVSPVSLPVTLSVVLRSIPA